MIHAASIDRGVTKRHAVQGYEMITNDAFGFSDHWFERLGKRLGLFTYSGSSHLCFNCQTVRVSYSET